MSGDVYNVHCGGGECAEVDREGEGGKCTGKVVDERIDGMLCRTRVWRTKRRTGKARPAGHGGHIYYVQGPARPKHVTAGRLGFDLQAESIECQHK